VKFIFATTEVNKVPVTVLSRCQRFDLRRVPADTLAAHFADIVTKEGASAEPEALALIARAAEGSVRDGLSVLDQALSHSAGDAITAAAIREMLGLADRSAVRDLLDLVLKGDAPGALTAIAQQYDLGRDPEMLLRELLETIHAITRRKLAPADDPALSVEERARLADWAQSLSFPALHRLWQLLLKGLAEVQTAPVPLQAAEMALLRLIHASELPDPATLVKRLLEGDETPPSRSREGSVGAPAPTAELPSPASPPAQAEPVEAPARESAPSPPTALPADYEALVALFREHTEPRLAHILHDELRLVEFAPPRLVLAHDGRQSKELLARIGRCLADWTGQDWRVDFTSEGGAPTLHEAHEAAIAAQRETALADPLVTALAEAFPDADLISIETPERTQHAQSR
jgi:DNA polymerase-3 subunit gamma/tau